MPKNIPHKRVVIYTRYSSDMQRPESCEIQERAVKQELARLKIPIDNVSVLKDEAIAGTVENRPSFQTLMKWCSEGRVGVEICLTGSKALHAVQAITTLCPTATLKWSLRRDLI